MGKFHFAHPKLDSSALFMSYITVIVYTCVTAMHKQNNLAVTKDNNEMPEIVPGSKHFSPFR